MTTAEILNIELDAFEKEKPRLLAEGKAGKFALVGHGAVVDVWDTYEDALQAGYGKFGLNTRFLVKKIEGLEAVQFFSRDIVVCQP